MWRFKTEKEFIKEFGEDWKREVRCTWNEEGEMDHLLGWTPPNKLDQFKIYEIMRYRKTNNFTLRYNDDEKKRFEDYTMSWSYSYDMFTEANKNSQLEFDF